MAKRKEVRTINRKEVRESFDRTQRDAERNSEHYFERTRELNSYFWQGIDPRRRQEVADAGMIREDHGAMANLPMAARHHEYPKAGYYSMPYLDSLVDAPAETDDDGIRE